MRLAKGKAHWVENAMRDSSFLFNMKVIYKAKKKRE